ncbi:homoserine dehydrogenase [Virgibacillus oceani]|uniref:Homoserine dehydrogenase n=1 Tax=Virgibacillus oceani TaxID=1479511 RepID=A0A917HJF5_9BACI|nr:homoserine dehydrogenase [Virgibacillus oceani]GGG80627.1 homoserine dehydrogenase [Virgibacillus oceani]
MKNDVSIGLLGLGVVGSGVIKLIENHRKELVHQVGCDVNIKRVLIRDPEKIRNVQLDQTLLTTDPDEVLKNPEIDVIVEVMGGTEQARHYILEAFQAKKHVITANKDLIALYGPELEDAASRNQCDLFYEASVAGGIPILRGLSDGLVSDRIHQVMGIVNGTTNYILTKMNEEGTTYEDALKKAQELGFAEADPTADVEGLDAARKMAILSRLAFSTDIELEDVEVNGISNLTLSDLQYGKQLGYTMKLIGFANCHNQNVEVSVQPTFLSNEHPLAAVKNEYNAVYVNGEAVGETMFYGPGAGSLPTATAVMSDVINVIKNMRLGVNGRQFIKPRFKSVITPPDQRFSQHYLRLDVRDEAGALSAISHLFNEMDISFERVLQIPSSKSNLAEIIFVTHRTSLEKFEKAMFELERLNVVESIHSSYRVEGDVEE